MITVSFYGDDFTGSTDAMEALASHGIDTVLFLGAPEKEQIARFPDATAIGIAGDSRGRSPEWMSEHLPPVFERLRSLGAPICHYKVCSTFDSSPTRGSIGRAIEIGQQVFGSPYVPVVVGVPRLRRYCLFGNLFAAAGQGIYRIDRHPTMSRHPSTPMHEADLRLHLGMQTARRIALLDILALQGAHTEERFRDLLAARPEVVLFDTLDDASLLEVGRLLWKEKPAFVVGSSGVEYALTACWRAAGELPPAPVFPPVGAVDRVIAISGSCSPATESQIRWAVQHGFRSISLDIRKLQSSACEEALRHLQAGSSVILHTALGAADPDLVNAPDEFHERAGAMLGQTLRELLCRSGVRRAVICGGDTSARAGQQLGIYALTMRQPLAPGVPLCLAHSEDSAFAGLEIAFKGGQVGGEDFLGLVRNGGRKGTSQT